jgi:hypothetical protein
MLGVLCFTSAVDRRCRCYYLLDALHVLFTHEGNVTRTAHHNDMQRALYLVPLDSASPVKPFACNLREVVKIGRSNANELPASVSRGAVEVTAKVAGGTFHLHVLVMKSTAHVLRAADPQVTRHSAGEELQVRAQMMLHALCVPLQGCSRGNRSGCPAPAGGRRPALPWQGRAGQWLQSSGDIERQMDLSDVWQTPCMAVSRLTAGSLSAYRRASAPITQGAQPSSPQSGRSWFLVGAGHLQLRQASGTRCQVPAAAVATQRRRPLLLQLARSAACT